MGKPPHKCPRCQETTDATCYCPACVAILRRPSQPQRRATNGNWREWQTGHGKRF